MPSIRTPSTAGQRPASPGHPFQRFASRAWCDGDPQKFYPGQLVLRLRDETVLEILDRHPISECYLLEDYSWVSPREIEDPLTAGRRRDLERSARREELKRAIEAGDFDAVFPSLRGRGGSERGVMASLPAVTGWTLAIVEGAILAVLLSGALY